MHVIEKNRLTTGAAVQMMEAARGFALRGHSVMVAGPAGGDLRASCAAAGVSYIRLPLRRLVDPTSVFRLRHQLRSLEPHILHVHKGRSHAAALVAAAGVGHYPLVVVNRGVTFPLDFFNKWKYRHPRVRAVVCVADAVREVVIRTGNLDRDRVHTVHGGTDPAVFDSDRIGGEKLRRKLGLHPHQPLICLVSTRDWKGWSELIAAFSKIAPKIPDARLLFVGCASSHERVAIDEAAREAGIGDRIMTLPFRSDMPDVLAACDVVVDASWSGTGITGTIREAMAMQRAVVATDCGGNRELVIDGEVGLLVPPRDVDALAAALTCLLKDPTLRQKLGAAARKRVVGHFSTEQRIEKLEALYRRIIADLNDPAPY